MQSDSRKRLHNPVRHPADISSNCRFERGARKKWARFPKTSLFFFSFAVADTGMAVVNNHAVDDRAPENKSQRPLELPAWG